MLRNRHLKPEPAGLCASATIVLSRVAAFSLDRPPPMPPPDRLNLITSDGFSDYALLDCGAGRKLERFGKIVVDRPEPQALWQPRLGKVRMGEGARRLLGLRRGRREGQVAHRQAGAGRLAGAHRWRHDELQARRALAPRTFPGAGAALAMDGRAASRKSKARRRAFSIFSATPARHH